MSDEQKQDIIRWGTKELTVQLATLAGSKDYGGVEGHPIRSITAQGYCCWRALTRGNHGAFWTRLRHLVWNCAGS